VQTQSHYQVLGVSPAATPEEIKHAYRRAALSSHPDRNPTDPKAEDKFKAINLAYEILSDQQKRTAYDQTGSGRPYPGPFDSQNWGAQPQQEKTGHNAESYASQGYAAQGANGADGQAGPFGGRGPSWQNLATFAGSVWGFAKDVTETVVNTEAGRHFAKQVITLDSRHTSAGNYRITAACRVEEMMAARDRMNDSQKQAFANEVGVMVANYVYRILNS
jgi:DnaJ-class molecular chaperone